MALKATINKVELSIADMDRNYFQTHQLTVAQHPSETNERMMVRLLVFALHADDALKFTKGLSTDDEPDLWQKHLNGDILLWIELGQPDEKRIRKACGRSKHVIIYCYNNKSTSVWWQQIKKNIQRFANLKVFSLENNASSEIAKMLSKNMQLNYTKQDDDIWFTNRESNVEISLTMLK